MKLVIKFTILFCLFFTAIHSDSKEKPEQLIIHVNDQKSLFKAIKTTNKRHGNTKIILAKGTYKLKTSLRLRFDHITLTSQSTNPEDVILIGSGMKKSKSVKNLIDVSASFIEISGLTLSEASNHIIQVHGKKNADHFKLTNSILRDSYQQLLKVTSARGKNVPTSDFGLIKDCTFEYSKGVGPNYYIGGIDAHNANNWLVENNQFRNIASPADRISEFAIHFWDGSSDNIIKGNTITNSDRGIGFGMKKLKPTSGGKIIGNKIVHNDLTHNFSDVGISILNSSNILIENNVILLSHDYPNAIEYRFKKTRNIIIRHNTVNKKITKRNRASAIVEDNIYLEN
jgi:hypothetical protein